MWFVESIWCRKRVLFAIFYRLWFANGYLKSLSRILAENVMYSVDIPGSVHMSQNDKVSKYYSDSDVDGGNCEGGVEVMVTN